MERLVEAFGFGEDLPEALRHALGVARRAAREEREERLGFGKGRAADSSPKRVVRFGEFDVAAFKRSHPPRSGRSLRPIEREQVARLHHASRAKPLERARKRVAGEADLDAGRPEPEEGGKELGGVLGVKKRAGRPRAGRDSADVRLPGRAPSERLFDEAAVRHGSAVGRKREDALGQGTHERMGKRKHGSVVHGHGADEEKTLADADQYRFTAVFGASWRAGAGSIRRQA